MCTFDYTKSSAVLPTPGMGGEHEDNRDYR